LLFNVGGDWRGGKPPVVLAKLYPTLVKCRRNVKIFSFQNCLLWFRRREEEQQENRSCFFTERFVVAISHSCCWKLFKMWEP
jgi:hypothetical protein